MRGSTLRPAADEGCASDSFRSPAQLAACRTGASSEAGMESPGLEEARAGSTSHAISLTHTPSMPVYADNAASFSTQGVADVEAARAPVVNAAPTVAFIARIGRELCGSTGSQAGRAEMTAESVAIRLAFCGRAHSRRLQPRPRRPARDFRPAGCRSA